MKAFDDAVKFLQGIKKDDGVVITYNNDGDGICSCVLIMKYLESRGCKEPFIISQPMPPEDSLLRKIQTSAPDKIIFLDMAIDQEQGFMKRLGNICDMLIVDHHQITKDMNRENVVHFNPRLENPKIYQSTTYLAYRLTSALAGMTGSLWIAAVGMVSDYNLEDSQDVVKLVKEKYNVKNKSLYRSHFGRLADMIAAAKATKQLTMDQLVGLFLSIKDPYDIESVRNGKLLLESHREVQDELERIESEFDVMAEKTGDIIFYKFSSKYNLRSPVSTMLSERHRDKIVVVYNGVASWIDVSARNQSKRYNVGALLKKAVEGLHGSGGGHEAAAGAKVPEKNWEKFKERFVELVNESS